MAIYLFPLKDVRVYLLLERLHFSSTAVDSRIAGGEDETSISGSASM